MAEKRCKDSIIAPKEYYRHEEQEMACVCRNCGKILGIYTYSGLFDGDENLPLVCPKCGVRLRRTEQENSLSLSNCEYVRKINELEENNKDLDIQCKNMSKALRAIVCDKIDCKQCPLYDSEKELCSAFDGVESGYSVIANDRYRLVAQEVEDDE